MRIETDSSLDFQAIAACSACIVANGEKRPRPLPRRWGAAALARALAHALTAPRGFAIRSRPGALGAREAP
ncbi:Hypothetical protein A7982_00646 [Minicystis rosea]|nr:Hypothetical protein A7982_00646 [Minicystis rosea]